MVVNKPAIMVYCHEPDPELLKEVLAGIEEEGVLCQVIRRDGEVDDLAYEAACDSMLGSGIGMESQHIAMQMYRLPKGKNVFELLHPTFRQCRALGANSARAVKKLPFRSCLKE